MADVIGYDRKPLGEVQMKILRVLAGVFPHAMCVRDLRYSSLLQNYGWHRLAANLTWLRIRGYVVSSRPATEVYTRWQLGPLADELIERGLIGQERMQ